MTFRYFLNLIPAILLGATCVLHAVESETVKTKDTIPPHSPTPVPVLTASGAAGAKAISLQ